MTKKIQADSTSTTQISNILSVEKIREHIEETVTKDMSSTIPTIGIVGCGGCGINIIKQLKMGNIKKYIVDTSLSNSKDIGDDIHQHYIESDGNSIGSGRIRKTNFKEIQNSISHLKAISDNNDITIVIHSTAGGSGSVIGPLICKQLAIQKKAFIVIVVVDSYCRMSTTNSINTLNSYKQISETENIYIPAHVVSNKNSKDIADKQTIGFIYNFIYSMTSNDIEEMDLLNKLNFLRPSIINEEHVGFYGMEMFEHKKPLEELNENVHSIYIVNNSGDLSDINIPNSYITYVGKNRDNIFISFAIGTELSEDIINLLTSRLEHFHSMNLNSGSKSIGNKPIGSTDKSGLIL